MKIENMKTFYSKHVALSNMIQPHRCKCSKVVRS